MTILPLHPAENQSPDALRAFVEQCRAMAVKRGKPQLVSISLAVEALDPLAVLESIFEPDEPHFYAERPSAETAIAGAEVATQFHGHGANRFIAARDWMRDMLENTVAVGDVAAPFGGPHFFSAFAFAEESEPGEPFPAATVFVPRWQVALAGPTTTAVANFLIAPDSPVEAIVERVWRAHAKFKNFEYRSSPEVPSLAPAASASSPKRALSTREVGDYRAAVARGIERIAAGEFQKIVLARAQDVVADRVFHPLEMLNGLRQRFPDCYSFSFTTGAGPSFIGATPERLVRVSHGVLETVALAGSRARGVGAAEDAALAAQLVNSDKERREHRQVLDDIVARLGQLGLTATHAAQPQIRRLANVQHLQTVISAELSENTTVLDVIAALHPTPAVGGSPRVRAIPAIRAIEGFPRGLYAGALGWLNARGGGEFFVGIRSAVVAGAEARVYAGAGIVAGSEPEKEFAETELKFIAMLDAFGF
jgi:menaquinone-specific isochorismate synthase